MGGGSLSMEHSSLWEGLTAFHSLSPFLECFDTSLYDLSLPFLFLFPALSLRCYVCCPGGGRRGLLCIPCATFSIGGVLISYTCFIKHSSYGEGRKVSPAWALMGSLHWVVGGR